MGLWWYSIGLGWFPGLGLRLLFVGGLSGGLLGCYNAGFVPLGFVFCLGVRVVTVFWFGLLVRGFFGVCGWLGLLWIGLLVSGVGLDLWIWLGGGLVPWARATRSGLTFGLRLLGVGFWCFAFVGVVMMQFCDSGLWRLSVCGLGVYVSLWVFA